MKTIMVMLLLLAAPAVAQTVVAPAPAVQPTVGTPTDAEINNAYGICQAHRFKNAWQAGYENCDAVEKAFQSRIEKMQQQTVQDVINRIK